jgi:hypothetical protein
LLTKTPKESETLRKRKVQREKGRIRGRSEQQDVEKGKKKKEVQGLKQGQGNHDKREEPERTWLGGWIDGKGLGIVEQDVVQILRESH